MSVPVCLSKPKVVHTTYCKYLVTSPPDEICGFGVIGDTRSEALKQYSASLQRWRELVAS